jgi:hypothetical protein
MIIDHIDIAVKLGTRKFTAENAEDAERKGITVPTTSAISAISAVNSPGLPIRPHGSRLR